MTKTIWLYLLALLSGLLLSFSWFPHGFLPLITIAFVPLLLVEKSSTHSSKKFRSFTLFLCSYITFLIWNVLTTWWVKNASFEGAILAITANALLMALVFILFHTISKRLKEAWKYLVFCCFWITWEFLHLDWDLSYPWLTLGNIFSDTNKIVQWYEYTGVFGGSLWILIANSMIASCFELKEKGFAFHASRKKITSFALLVTVPVLISLLILKNQPNEKGKEIEVVIVQPNIDPYNEKFSGSVDTQVDKMLKLAAEKTDTNTAYLIFPETALPEEIWESEWEQNLAIQQFQLFLKKFPKTNVIIGASTAKFYLPDEPLSSTARKFTREEAYYDNYNTALQLAPNGGIQVYHKSKLVPGVEKLPFPFIFDKLAIDLGGTTGSLGTQENRSVLVSEDKQIKVAPVICYESIYGEYTSDYVTNGANLIAIITNDGWWGDTPGYKQHLAYGTLRAIETRRWIARSANTGISCFITPSGEIQQATSWWVPAVIKEKVEIKNRLTFYVRWGDYIARATMYASLLLILYSWLVRFKILKK